MNIEATLTQGPVGRTMVRLSVPILGGIFSIIAFNLADTYFVSQLGTRELAAMSFTFPVVMVLIGIAFGLSTGTTTVVSQTIGRGEQEAVRRISSDSLVLSFLSVLLFAGIGMVTIEPLFTLLGASPDLLPLIRGYMMLWYPGVVLLVVPMVANASIRASGDTKIPALIMMGGTITNVILDPLFIFGWLGFPRMGLQGAAVATLISRFAGTILSLAILHFRDRRLVLPRSIGVVWQSWKQVGKIAIPAAFTNLMLPIGLAVVTRLISAHGSSAVAAWGAGSRISSFALIPVMAYCSGLVPFVGQNWGAELFDRVSRARGYGYWFAAIWGALMVGVLHVGGEWVATLFSEDQAVITEIVRYLWIVPLGYATVGILSVTEETLNAIGKPIFAAVQTLVHMFLVYIPLGFIGSFQWGLTGLLGGLTLADSLGGLVGMGLARWMCLRGEREKQK